MKFLFACILSFTLLLGNVANAAMLCCNATEMESSMDMPCHDDEEYNANATPECDCQTCLKLNSIMVNPTELTNIGSPLTASESVSFYSFGLSATSPPPKI